MKNLILFFSVTLGFMLSTVEINGQIDPKILSFSPPSTTGDWRVQVIDAAITEEGKFFSLLIVAAVQRQLGHQNAAYSLQYTRITKEELNDALDDREKK